MQESNIVQNSISPSIMQNIPLVNSTQILAPTNQVINSQIPVTTSVQNPSAQAPQVSQTFSYIPIVSAIQQPKTQNQGKPVVKVVPIYDE